jgi:hypothetical protein
MSTPKKCRISTATRTDVHRSVGKPKSVALAASQLSTCDSCSDESFGGAPERTRVCNPLAPWLRHALSQRRTERKLTPVSSAASPAVSPSTTRCTANRRAYANACAVLGMVMEANVTKSVKKW